MKIDQNSTNNNFHPLSKKYRAVLNSIQSYRITIVGKDPYPTEPTGIPFCKKNWDSLKNYHSSGRNVLISLGVNIEQVSLEYTPEEYFIYLAREKRIIFLNLSYNFLNGICKKAKHSEYLEVAENINRRYLLKSEHIILCGEAEKIKWYSYLYTNTFKVVHPDNRCKISRFNSVKEKWEKRWGQDSLKNEFNLEI